MSPWAVISMVMLAAAAVVAVLLDPDDSGSKRRYVGLRVGDADPAVA